MSTPWAEMEPVIRDRAYRRLNNDPQILLETDSWFTVDADLIYARLIGYEDEVVQDGLLLPRVEHDIHVPIHQRLTISRHEIAPGVYDFGGGPIMSPFTPEPMRIARYALQSGCVTLSVSAMYYPPVERLRDDNTAKIAYLRYRRRT